MISENLVQIDRWLNLNAVKIAKQSLNPPATVSEVEELEMLVNQHLPIDFKNLYFWHDGLSEGENLGNLFLGLDFFPIRRIITEYKQNLQNKNIPLINYDLGIEDSNIFNPKWIKFASDGSRTGLFLDLQPAIEGRYGQIIFVDHDYQIAILVANSIDTLISDFVSDLENNLYYLDSEALEEDGNHFLDVHPTIDISNWIHSIRWKRELLQTKQNFTFSDYGERWYNCISQNVPEEVEWIWMILERDYNNIMNGEFYYSMYEDRSNSISIHPVEYDYMYNITTIMIEKFYKKMANWKKLFIGYDNEKLHIGVIE